MRLVPYHRADVQPRLFPEVTRFFDDFFSDVFLPSTSPRSEGWIPAVDILEKEGNLIVRAELPGMNEKDIDLKIEGNLLTLKGERRFHNEEKKNEYRRIETAYGAFSRSFTLPDTVDTDKIKADYKNGILTVTLPQRPEVRPREIPVSLS